MIKNQLLPFRSEATCSLQMSLLWRLVRSGLVWSIRRYTMLTSPKATKADVEAHFATHGTGEITEIKLMNGFGFIEYKDAMDARDVVPGKCSVRLS